MEAGRRTAKTGRTKKRLAAKAAVNRVLRCVASVSAFCIDRQAPTRCKLATSSAAPDDIAITQLRCSYVSPEISLGVRPMNYVPVLATTICANCREESAEIYMHGAHFRFCFECGEHEQARIDAELAKEIEADERNHPSLPHVR